MAVEPDDCDQYHLEAEDIHKHFGGIKALDGANVFVKKNKLISLIGPNGIASA